MRKLLIALSILALTACSSGKPQKHFFVSETLIAQCDNIPEFLDNKPKTLKEAEFQKGQLMDMYAKCWWKQNELGYFTKLKEINELKKMR